jgi:hypothetical protein
MISYAGIGNRKLPPGAGPAITELARRLSTTHILRTGGAEGADQCFMAGSRTPVVYRAHTATPEAIDLAMAHHPAPHACNDYARRLLGRNAMIVLGSDLDAPVRFVLCWCADEERGGTALAIRIARAHGVAVYNMARWPRGVTEGVLHDRKRQH